MTLSESEVIAIREEYKHGVLQQVLAEKYHRSKGAISMIVNGILYPHVNEPTDRPRLEQIYGGKWAAHGDGWAVHGATRDEALDNYRKAEQRRREILARPDREGE